MKNIFRFLMAAVIFFGAVSCAKEDISTSLAGGEVEVTLSVDVPELGTRAFGDGLTVDQLFIAVYEQGRTDALPISHIDGTGFQGSEAFSGGRATVTMVLLKDKTYDLVFWAQKSGTGAYDVNLADGRNIEANYGALCNLEDRDAFFLIRNEWKAGVHETTFTLNRPFAQINVANSDADVAFVTANGATIETSALTVNTKVANVLDMKTGDVAGSVDVDFDPNAIPTEAFHIAGYNYLAMNYLLVNEKDLVNLEFVFTDDKGVAYTREYSNVPVQRNYRTNILGQIISSPIDFTVVIDPIFTEPATNVVMTAADLKQQIENAPAGEQIEIVLGGDIDLNDLAGLLGTRASQPTGGLTIEANKEIILNLAEGSTLRHTYTQTSPYALIDNYGKLTIKGNGTIVYTDNGNGGNWTSSTIWNKGTLVVEGNVTLVNNSSDDVATNGYPHVIDNYSTLTINGGTLTNNTNYSTIRIWCTTDEDTIVTINGGTFNGCIDFHNPSSAANKGTLTINGGTFNADTYTNCTTRLLGFGADVDEMVATINGGTFNGAIDLRNWSGSDLNSKVYTIHRGTFSVDPSKFVAENSFVQQANGKYAVCGVGAIVECAGAKAVIFSVNATEAKAVSVAEINLNGKFWQDAMDWAVGLGNDWALASMEDLNAIYDNRVALNDAIEADSAENALFWEGDELYIKNGSVYYAHYISSTEVPNGVDANGNAYFPNRVFFKQFNDKGYSDVLYSAFDCINKYAPLRDNYFARGVYTIAK